MDAPTPTRVIVADRQTGKTHDLISWLCDGHAVDAWPGWSRILVVATPELVSHTVGAFPALQHELWSHGNGGLGKLVLSFDEYLNLRGIGHDIEVAIDDVEMLLARLLRTTPMRPTLLAMRGQPLPAGQLSVEHAQRVRT